jgi:hypothetical protein
MKTLPRDNVISFAEGSVGLRVGEGKVSETRCQKNGLEKFNIFPPSLSAINN